MEAGVRVFITNYAGHDYQKAEIFGELAFITKGYISFGSLDRLKFDICEEIAITKPTDYLLLSGTNIVCVLCALAWITKHGSVKLLVWDDKNGGKYRVQEIRAAHLNELVNGNGS